MVRFSMEIESGNAAFTEDAPGEVCRILEHVKTAVELNACGGVLHDINGNSVGTWSFDNETEED